MSLMVGGASRVVDRCRPLFASFASTVHYIGEEIGSGQIAKALNNQAYFCDLFALNETLRIAKSAGLSVDVMLDVINSSSGKSWASEFWRHRQVHRQTYTTGPATVALAMVLGISSSKPEGCMFDDRAGSRSPTICAPKSSLTLLSKQLPTRSGRVAGTVYTRTGAAYTRTGAASSTTQKSWPSVSAPTWSGRWDRLGAASTMPVPKAIGPSSNTSISTGTASPPSPSSRPGLLSTSTSTTTNAAVPRRPTSAPSATN